LRSPDLIASPLEEPGGVRPGPVHAAGKAGVEPIECALVEAHEPGGASLDVNIAPVPTKGIAGVEPASGAVEATTARPEALEPREKHAEWSKLQLPPPLSPLRDAPSMGKCRRGLEVPPPPRECECVSECRPKWVPQRTPPPPPQASSGIPGSLPQEAPNEGVCRHGLEASPPLPREDPSEGKCGPQRAP